MRGGVTLSVKWRDWRTVLPKRWHFKYGRQHYYSSVPAFTVAALLILTSILVPIIFYPMNVTAVPMPAPLVTTVAATDITASSATLNGYLDSPGLLGKGEFCTVYFEYGTTTSYGSMAYSPFMMDSPGSFSASISGLTPGITYHFRAVASTNICTSYGMDMTFKTSSNRPPNQPSSPSPSNGATGVIILTDLSWSCSDPDGDSLTYDVYFGTNSTPDSDEPVSNNQTGTTYDPGTLSYSTTYYWKIVAHDGNGGTTEGSVWSFTTQSQYTSSSGCEKTKGCDVSSGVLACDVSSGDAKCDLLLPDVVNSSNTYYNDISPGGNNFYFWGYIFTSSFYDLPSSSTPLYDIRLKSGLDIFTDDKPYSFGIDYIGKEKNNETKEEYTLDKVNETHFTIYENYVAVTVSYTLNDTIPPTSRITDGPPAGGTITYNNVTFRWTAEDDITPTSELVYQYYLQGYDSSWKPGVNEWTSSTSVTYYNLPRGNYTFKVRAKDQAGNIEMDETSLNTRSFTIIAPTETFVFSPSIGPSGSGTATFKNKLDNFVLIEIYNGNTLFGEIWIADLASIKYSLSSSGGRYELFSENAAVIKHLPGGYVFVKNDPIVYSDSKSFALHIVQNLVSNPGGGGGSGVYRFSSRVLENSIREKNEVYMLKLQFYGKNKDAWYNYFIRYLSLIHI